MAALPFSKAAVRAGLLKSPPMVQVVPFHAGAIDAETLARTAFVLSFALRLAFFLDFPFPLPFRRQPSAASSYIVVHQLPRCRPQPRLHPSWQARVRPGRCRPARRPPFPRAHQTARDPPHRRSKSGHQHTDRHFGSRSRRSCSRPQHWDSPTHLQEGAPASRTDFKDLQSHPQHLRRFS